MSLGPPAAPVRVLAVDHTAGVAPFRKKFAALAAHPEIQLTVLAPSRWVENYKVVRAAAGGGCGYTLLTGAVGWPGYENRAFFRSGLGPAIRASHPDILHLWEEPFSLIALQALCLAKFWAPRARALFYSSDNLSADFHYSYRPSWFYARVERFAHRRCAAGTAVSEEVAVVLRAKGFAKSIDVIPHGLDLADYPTDPGREVAGSARRAAAEGARARLGLHTPVVGFLGRLVPVKAVDVLVRAVAQLPEPKPSLVIVGDGPDRVAIEELIEEMSLSRSTRLLPGVPHSDVPDLLAAIDVLTLPSRTLPRSKEQFGRVLIEGMAAGCVVIGSDSGAIPEVIGDAGLVFPENDVEGLAAALRRVLGDPGLAASLRAAGRRRVKERYTWDAVAARIVECYRRLV